MKLITQEIEKSLSNAYLKQSLKRNQIDKLVYELYGLSEEEIKIVEN